jgi:autotransporter-associated beta strand protein
MALPKAPRAVALLHAVILLAGSASAQDTSLVRNNTNDSMTVGATVTDGSGIPQGNPRTIRWSIVPDGTKLPNFYYSGSDPNRPSLLIADLDNDFSVPAGDRGPDLTTRPWFASFQNMVDRIANKTGFTFVYEPNDDGREIGASGSDGSIGVRGDMRIGAGPLSGALGYNGIPNGGPLPDMVLNSSFAWTASTLTMIPMHELHHGLGFLHVQVNGSGSASAVTGSGGNSNGPQFHDLIQLHRKYGDPFEKPVRNDTRANATTLGSLASGGVLRAGSNWGTTVSIGANDTNVATIGSSGDVDFFRIDTAGPMQVRATLTPRGTTYSYVTEGQTEATVDATRFMNLRFEVQNASGTVIATAAAAAAGAAETLPTLQLPSAGAWYFRVSMEGASSSPQAYTLEVADADSDGDGMTDSAEFAAGRDASDPADLAFSFTTDNDFEGWTNSAGVSPKSVSEGAFHGSVSASDPQIWRTGFGFDGTRVPTLLLRIRSSTSGTCQIFWGRVGADGFSGSRVMTVNVTQADVWQLLSFPMGTHAEWTGQTITRLRIDPPGGTGATFSIDFLAGQNGGSALVWHPGAEPGGAGSWDAATAAWRLDTNPLPWLAASRAVFRGTAGAVTVDAPASASGLVFETNGYSLGGSSTLTLQADSVLQTATGVTATVSTPLAATTLVKSGSGTLVLNGPPADLTGFAINGGTINLQPTADALIDGPVTGTGALRKGGSRTLTLNGPNSFSGGVTIDAGALRLTRSDSLGGGTKSVALTNGTAGKCRIILAGGGSGILLPASISFSSSNNSTTEPAFLNESGNNTIAGNFTLTAGGGGTRFTSQTGRLTLTGTLTPNTSGRVVHLDGAADGEIQGILRDQNTTNLLGLEKTGTGTWTISGASSATGAATVLQGTLQVTGSLAAPVSVQGGGTLAGTGSIAALTLSATAPSLATLAPGTDGIGKLSVTDTATLGPQSRYTWELRDADGTEGSGWDLLEARTLALTATPSAKLLIVIAPGTPPLTVPSTPRAFVIARGTASLTGFAASAIQLDSSAFPAAAGTWSLRQTGNTLELVLTPSGYTSWIAASGLNGNDALPGADADHDGLANLIEFVLGGQPNPALPGASSVHLAPTATLTSTHLEFRHRRTHAARDAAGLSIIVEYGGLLDSWSPAVHGSGGITIDVSENAHGAGTDEVIVRLPRALAPDGRLFSRLRASLP